MRNIWDIGLIGHPISFYFLAANQRKPTLKIFVKISSKNISWRWKNQFFIVLVWSNKSANWISFHFTLMLCKMKASARKQFRAWTHKGIITRRIFPFAHSLKLPLFFFFGDSGKMLCIADIAGTTFFFSIGKRSEKFNESNKFEPMKMGFLIFFISSYPILNPINIFFNLHLSLLNPLEKRWKTPNRYIL